MEVTFTGSTVLDVLKQMAEFIAMMSPSSHAPAVAVPEVPKYVNGAAEEEKKKPKKPKIEAEAVFNEEPAPVKAKKITKTDVRTAFKEVMSTHGLPKVSEILNKFGANSISELEEAKYPETMKAIADCTLV